MRHCTVTGRLWSVRHCTIGGVLRHWVSPCCSQQPCAAVNMCGPCAFQAVALRCAAGGGLFVTVQVVVICTLLAIVCTHSL